MVVKIDLGLCPYCSSRPDAVVLDTETMSATAECSEYYRHNWPVPVSEDNTEK